MRHCSTYEKIADIFTKVLEREKLENLILNANPYEKNCKQIIHIFNYEDEESHTIGKWKDKGHLFNYENKEAYTFEKWKSKGHPFIYM